MNRLLRRIHYIVTLPVTILFVLDSTAIRPEYRLGWFGRLRLGWRFARNQMRIPTLSSYKAHLVMALKLLEMPSEVEGIVVECGAFKGGSAANLSIICQVVGRELHIFDSFEGLPPLDPRDREAPKYEAGAYAASLEEVRSNIARCGVLEVCEFHQGWFEDTLPHVTEPVVLMYLDVDLEASLHTCLVNLWPRVVEKGHVFTDEYSNLAYCSVFFSTEYWRRYFDREPPGLIGAGGGLALGEYFVGPFEERDQHPLQHPNGPAYTRKDWRTTWTYFPD